MDIRILCYLASLLLATNTTLAADIKKWIDDDGRVHFGDLAPKGVDNVEIKPENTTTTPSARVDLKKTMRPGELRMIENHDKRGKRLIKEKKQAAKQAKLRTKQTANAKNRCVYNRQKKERLKRIHRAGASRSEKSRIEEKLSNHNRQIKEYCY